jgi:hypothetical protein
MYLSMMYITLSDIPNGIFEKIINSLIIGYSAILDTSYFTKMSFYGKSHMSTVRKQNK